MSNSQYADYSRSVSDGDLSGVDRKPRYSSEKDDDFDMNGERLPFFTLPRWMSVRKKRNRIKYIKVDVPFSSENRPKQYQENEKEKKGNFFRKLFRSNSFFTNDKTNKNIPRSPTLPVMSTSNTDIRNCNEFTFHSFDYQYYFKDRIPAICGIRNHGNTCFMNAVIQCLSNTDSFAEYFVTGQFKIDLLRHNKTHSKKFGTRGEVTQQLGTLLKSLWTCQYYPNISNKFKNLVAKYGEQYEGNDQHDAQEFLLWLLDKAHEDLNSASKQKYKKTKGYLNRSDEDIAAETLANHLRCNSSYIQEIFQGQFRSSLCCLGCGRFSNTFDPYLCVSLPVPHFQTVPVILNVVLLDEKIKLGKIGVSMESQATIFDLFEKLNLDFGISKKDVVLLEIFDANFKRTFQDTDPVSYLTENENIYIIETPPQGPNVSVEQEKIVILILNAFENDAVHKMLWRPFAISVLRECSYTELENEIFSVMNHMFKENFNVDHNSFVISVIVGDTICEKICSSVDMPLYMPAIDKALLLNSCATPHIKLCVHWKEEVKDMLKTEFVFIEEHSSVEEVMQSKRSSEEVSLYECFDLYFNEERLGNEDARICPYCRHRLPCVKTLQLWTIPDVLIIHLKRFRQSSSQRVKTTTFVDFPYSGLDLSPYVVDRSNQNSQQMSSNTLPTVNWSPWKRSRSHLYSRWEDNVYELHAVCNHNGSMQGGHYTAYCKNPINGHWYFYDDIKVQEVSAKEVVSADAYMLFYQRSSQTSCASSSSSGYSSASSANSVGPDHWVFRLTQLFQDVQINSKSQDSLFDVGKTSSLDRRHSLHRPFTHSAKSCSSTIHHNGTKTLPHPSHTKTSLTSYEKQAFTESTLIKKEEIPPPPPPAKHYWTVTSV